MDVPLPSSPIAGVSASDWLVFLMFACWLVTRALKSTAFDALLHRMKLPSIPRSWIPEVAIGFGAAESIVQAVAQGATFKHAAAQVLWGLFAGGGAVAVHEALAPTNRGKVGALIFGLTNPAQACEAARKKCTTSGPEIPPPPPTPIITEAKTNRPPPEPPKAAA